MIDRLKNNSIELRPVSIDDADMLLDWRNDPETRKFSVNMAKVKKKNHLLWLVGILNCRHRKIFIAEYNGSPVGTVRSDYHENFHELSWTIAPNARGKGLGKKMVAKFAGTIEEPILAKIKKGNDASIHIAEYAGMTFEKKKKKFLYYTRDVLSKASE